MKVMVLMVMFRSNVCVMLIVMGVILMVVMCHDNKTVLFRFNIVRLCYIDSESDE